MKVFLMFKERDFDIEAEGPWNRAALTQDLELEMLFEVMAGEDETIRDAVRTALLTGTGDPAAVLYRQEILRDCLNNSAVIRQAYAIAVEAIENRRKHHWGILGRYPDSILSGATHMLEGFMESLRQLRTLADRHTAGFASAGFRRLFGTLQKELSDDYFAHVVKPHLTALRFPSGVLQSAGLGIGGRGVDYTLHRFPAKGGVLKSLFTKKTRRYSMSIAERDMAGARALGELRNRGINLVADAAARSADHILGFFTLLRNELAFYLGCLNLYERLSETGVPICFPRPLPRGTRTHSFRGLSDVCLALHSRKKVTGNDLDAAGTLQVVITGANQGGKSVFLRSVGLAQLLMQAGMFVTAESFSANVCDGVVTHYKREEDVSMESGKLDEELARMSEIVDHLTTDSLLLLNESFAATNEREGSEIARQISSALIQKGVKTFFVTHLTGFAGDLFLQKRRNVRFLRAERLQDGARTFRMVPAGPLETSYGLDLYDKIFTDQPPAADKARRIQQELAGPAAKTAHRVQWDSAGPAGRPVPTNSGGTHEEKS